MGNYESKVRGLRNILFFKKFKIISKLISLAVTCYPDLLIFSENNDWLSHLGSKIMVAR